MNTSTSTKTGTSYQTTHTYFFVPSDYGASALSTSDDTNTPGAYLRLGGYSDIEFDANDADELASFYPTEHRAEEGGDALAHAAGSASDDAGIAMAANGRILVFAGEKMYVNSVDAMNIDTQSTLDITADGVITIESEDEIKITAGDNKNITLNAGGGSGSIKEVTDYKETTVFGETMDIVTDDKYSYLQADNYKIQMGRDTQIILGGKFHMWIGASISIRCAVDVQIDLAAKLKYWTFKLDIGFFKFDFYKFKWELSTSGVETKVNKFNFSLVDMEQKAVEAKQKQIDLINSTISARKDEIVSEAASVAANSGGPTVNINALILVM